MDLNAYSEMKTIKYLSFILETRDLADKSLPVECHSSTCGNHQDTNITTQDTLKSLAIYGVGQQVLIFNACQDIACIQIQRD